jgi:uncharacterized protein YcbK (DUF882 family)
MISMEDYITASGKYPERLKSPELTDEVKSNANLLLMGVSNFLKEIGIDPDKVKVSSGFRPSDVNASIKGAAKKSSHLIGNAIDLEDFDGKIDEAVAKHSELLRKYGLFQENPDNTKNWCHIDRAVRPDRPSRQFNP